MLRTASILRRCMRDEAALCQTECPRRKFGAFSGGAPGGQGARSRLPADGFGYARGDGRRPDPVSFVGVSRNRALLLQSDGRSVLHGIGSGKSRVHRAPLMKHGFCSLIVAVYMGALVGAAAEAAPASAPAASPAHPGQPDITLDKIMSDPDWIGPAAKDAYWSADGRSVYYSAKRSGSPIVDLHRV